MGTTLPLLASTLPKRVRPDVRKHLIDAARIGDVGDHGFERNFISRKLVGDVEQAVLVAIDEHQPHRSSPDDLPAQLGADRAACASDEHAFVGEELDDWRVVEAHRIPSEQVFDLQLADLLDVDALADQIREPWQRRNTELVRFERADDLPQRFARGAR
jgi:hypothetical protein